MQSRSLCQEHSLPTWRHPCLRVELRGPAAKVSSVILCSGRLLGCLKIQNGHKQLRMERTTTSSLVPFQPFQPGRNNLRQQQQDTPWLLAHPWWCACMTNYERCSRLSVNKRNHNYIIPVYIMYGQNGIWWIAHSKHMLRCYSSNTRSNNKQPWRERSIKLRGFYKNMMSHVGIVAMYVRII